MVLHVPFHVSLKISHSQVEDSGRKMVELAWESFTDSLCDGNLKSWVDDWKNY